MKMHDGDHLIDILTGKYGIVDADELASGCDKIELDMGCGKGGFSLALAAMYPERRIVAADVMLGRLRKLASKVFRRDLTNVTLLRVEAKMLISRMLPDHCLDRVHLLCPDPWPKERHRGHRLMTSDFTTQLHRVLKLGGVLHFSSDDVPYRDSVERILDACGLFERAPEEICDVAEIKTEFEKLWLAQGKSVKHYSYRALPPPPFGAGH